MAAKKSGTRTKRAAQKAATPKKKTTPVNKSVQAAEPAVPNRSKLPNVLRLTRRSLGVLWRHKKLFAGIMALYALLTVIFVGGFGQGVNADEIKGQFANVLLGSLAAYGQLITSSASTAGEAAGVYQLFLTIFASLALIWALRQVYAGEHVRIRDAYYKAMYPLIPFMLLLLLICFQLLPMVIGTALYQFVIASGIAASTIEVVLWLGVALIGMVISAYFVTCSIIALLVVTLPDMAPWASYKLARKLVAGRRWTVLRKLLFLPLILFLLAAVILLPFIIIYAPASPFVLLLLAPLLTAVAHSYVYALYRELIGE